VALDTEHPLGPPSQGEATQIPFGLPSAVGWAYVATGMIESTAIRRAKMDGRKFQTCFPVLIVVSRADSHATPCSGSPNPSKSFLTATIVDHPGGSHRIHKNPPESILSAPPDDGIISIRVPGIRPRAAARPGIVLLGNPRMIGRPIINGEVGFRGRVRGCSPHGFSASAPRGALAAPNGRLSRGGPANDAVFWAAAGSEPARAGLLEAFAGSSLGFPNSALRTVGEWPGRTCRDVPRADAR